MKWKVLRICSDINFAPVPEPNDTAFIIEELSGNVQYLIDPTRFVLTQYFCLINNCSNYIIVVDLKAHGCKPVLLSWRLQT